MQASIFSHLHLHRLPQSLLRPHQLAFEKHLPLLLHQRQWRKYQLFFRDCFLAFYPSISQREAKTKAEKLTLGGFGLYAYPVESYEYVFGSDGRPIYNIIHHGDYSYVS